MHNTDRSIASFARSCFNYALSVKQDLWFSTKDTISKIYDHRFKDIFARAVRNRVQGRLRGRGHRVFLYADRRRGGPRHPQPTAASSGRCKNYDGDVMSDMIATAFGSLAMMTSVLVSPGGQL